MMTADQLKNAAALVGALTPLFGFCLALVKPLRTRLKTRVKSEIRKITRSAESEELLQKTHDLLQRQLDADAKWKADIEKQMALQNETAILQLRNTINHIYEKNLPEKAFSIREKENIVDMYAQYKKLGGNHYVERIYKEMLEWETISD